jgi:hypothetical protein
VNFVRRIRIEIRGKDSFWERAFHVEWEHQFPDRRLSSDGADRFVTDAEWLDDLQRVGDQTFCNILCAPENPPRRDWLKSLIVRPGG